MIIVSMGAGLGNQMYEYAFYAHLKELFPNEIIKVDTRYAFPLAHNGIEVFNIFNLQAEEASINEVKKLTKGYSLNGKGFDANTFFQKVRRKLYNPPHSMKIQRDYTEFDSSFLKKIDYDCYYLGVFANCHYFSNIEDKIKDLYKFPAITDEINLNYAEQIQKSNSVSIHVRRGDYATWGIELTSPEFYRSAIDIIEEHISDAQYYIFTDDAEYAREIFPDKWKFLIVEGNTQRNNFRDMHLMSLCKHNITANSTFSFWGAFLNENQEKIVVAPNLAFSGGRCPFVCDEWILI